MMNNLRKTTPMIRAVINSGRSTMCTSSSGATNSSKALEKVEAVESGLALRSLIPKEFTAESESYVAGKKIDFYEKVFNKGFGFIHDSFFIFLLFPAFAGFCVKTYKDILEVNREDKKLSHNNRY